ncbi:hypothetical protein DL770_007723 [Monosporascus sp. CRB-9-2]|nr:hypothetical protein DL770_007723 [Monosporascus sp. CRB-9-2]
MPEPEAETGRRDLPRRTRRTRFVCISDTHNCTVKLPEGDVLIHCGDLTNKGSITELSKQVAWLEKAEFECKLVVAGNHDLTLDAEFYEQYGRYFHHNQGPPQDPAECQALLARSESLIYLEHASRVVRLASPEGPRTTFSVFGSPYTPRYGRWAFQYEPRDDETAAALWGDIPLDADVVITHGPARTHLDESRGAAQGCEVLRQALWRVRPKIAVCGHIHDARGAERVRWDLRNGHMRYKELGIQQWEDPGVGNEKNSLVDLTARGGNPLDNHASSGVVEAPEPTTTQTALPVEAEPEGANPGVGARRLSADPESAANDQAALTGRLGRRETCFINCAVQTASYPHRGPRVLNKPIVVDLDLPVWDDSAPDD